MFYASFEVGGSSQMSFNLYLILVSGFAAMQVFLTTLSSCIRISSLILSYALEGVLKPLLWKKRQINSTECLQEKK